MGKELVNGTSNQETIRGGERGTGKISEDDNRVQKDITDV
jgi:hypothetical protein